MNANRFTYCLQFGLLLLLPNYAMAQGHFSFTPNTGSNMTVLIKADMVAAAGANGLKIGDEIAVFATGGLCVGSIAWAGKNTALTVWGDNDQTPKIDGASQGEGLFFRVWSSQKQAEYSATVAFATGKTVFTNDGIGIISNLVVSIPPAPQPLAVKNRTTHQANTSQPKPIDEKRAQTGKLASTDANRNSIAATHETEVASIKNPVQEPTPIQQPILDSTRRVETINIAWPSAGSKATKYWFEIAADTTMKNAIVDSALKSTDTIKAISGFAAGTYWWRVRSGTATVWNTFSPIKAITIKQTVVTPAPFAFAWQPAVSFQTTSTISYTLPIESKVLFKLYNNSGKTISRTFETQQAGTHTISFDSKELGKGSYSYTLDAGEFLIKSRFAIEE